MRIIVDIYKIYTCLYSHAYVDVLFFKLLVPGIKANNVTVFENDKVAVVQIKRSGPLNSGILIHVVTVDGTAIGQIV